MKKPKIFISSTIYDFKDLRSALKYWLEEMGYNVQLSEFNDFEKKLDKNSYDACLENIETCDYFILLIGSRVGGFYNYNNKTSITQKEYRKAYKLAKNKKIKIISFVRQDIWDIRDDRKALEKYLKKDYILTKEISDDKVDDIINHNSSFVNDAKFIFEFLNEVGRKNEMKQAIFDNKEFPNQNWIHQFNVFKDIIDVLNKEFNISNDLQYNIHLSNIRREIGNNLTVFLFKDHNNKIDTYYSYASFARNQLSKSFKENSKIKGQYLIFLSIFEYIGVGKGQKISTKFIYSALSSGAFFKYNKENKALEPSELHNGLLKLVQEIESLKQIEQQYSISSFNFNITKKYNKPDPNKFYSIDNIDLLTLIAIHDKQYNIIALSKYILSLIDGKMESYPKLLDNTPFQEEIKKIKDEKVNVEEAINALKDSKINM